MVHGGAWAFGSKDYKGVVESKVAHWLPRGYLFVSVDYRMLPDQDVSGQADDVARALAFVQAHAREWGGNPSRVTLMGHSAGAHLVALLSADPARAQAFGARRWTATVALDSAALDVTSIMQRPHLRLYDRASAPTPRCGGGCRRCTRSSRKRCRCWRCARRSVATTPARRRAPTPRRRGALGVDGEVLPQDLDHGGINKELGAEENYTAAVDRFLAAHAAEGPREGPLSRSRASCPPRHSCILHIARAA
jgi:acetyl esterase/lipase